MKDYNKVTDELRNGDGITVRKYIDELEKIDTSKKLIEPLILSDSNFTPYTLWKFLEELGYEPIDSDRNGWQMDFWVYFEKDGYKPLTISGTGITFEFQLQESDR